VQMHRHYKSFASWSAV